MIRGSRTDYGIEEKILFTTDEHRWTPMGNRIKKLRQTNTDGARTDADDMDGMD